MSELLSKAQKKVSHSHPFSLKLTPMKVAKIPDKKPEATRPEIKKPEPLTLKEIIEAARIGDLGKIKTAFDKSNSLMNENCEELLRQALANGKSDIVTFLVEKYPYLKNLLPPEIE